MAVKRKKQDATQDVNEIMQLLHPPIPTRDDSVDDNVSPEQKTGGDDLGKTVADLQAQLAKMQADAADLRRQNIALMSQPQVTVPPQRPVDNGQAPDPLEDPKGYAEYVQKKAMGDLDYQRQVDSYNAQQAQRQQEAIGSLWSEFNTKYKDYAGNSDRVQIAAERVAKRAQARGTDLQKYMFGATSVFMEDVVKEMDNLFGKPQVEGNDAEADDGEEDDRTVGIFGGGAQGGKPTTAKKTEKLGSISDDIKSWQEKTGYGR